MKKNVLTALVVLTLAFVLNRILDSAATPVVNVQPAAAQNTQEKAAGDVKLSVPLNPRFSF